MSTWSSWSANAQTVESIQPRPEWTQSRVQGSPDPPLPFRAERVFKNLSFTHPTVLTSAPGSDRLFVAEQGGKIFSIPPDPECKAADLVVDVTQLVEERNKTLDEEDRVSFESVYGLTFHPDFGTNHKCYICYTVRYQSRKRGTHLDGSRVVEVRLETETPPPRAILDSEREIITWRQGGHNGGCLKFGQDGMLYISTGDGGFAFPPDGLRSGQDVGNLLAAILRIDVDSPEGAKAYRIPPDNPFVDQQDARGEIWAYGVRNPWKMSFDRKTGDLWVGDVGWELWELVYRVRGGDNYGWSLVEGRQTVHAEGKRGPTPIVTPAVEIPHTEGASITGGFVYRGKRFPELQGHYIFGDWETRRFWGVPVDGDSLGPRKELVEPTVRIVGFAERNDGELLLLDYDAGTIHELARNEAASKEKSPFPTRLSRTGLFTSVEEHTPATGVVPFSIQAPQWSDHARGERWLGLPGATSIVVNRAEERVPGSMFSRLMEFPQDAVLMKTLSLEMTPGDPTTERRVETQILHFNGYDWRGYSYQWNDQQTDAELVEAVGATKTFQLHDAKAPGGIRTQTWRFASRMECIRCHNPWAEFTLAFNVAQLNRDDERTGFHQLETLYRIGVLKDPSFEPNREAPFAVNAPPIPPRDRPKLEDPHDAAASIEGRARAYLHANCAHCHRYNGGGSAKIYVPFDMPIAKTEAVGTRPTQGTFGIHDAMIIAPGDPYRSVLYFRMAKSGPGHMPHLGSSVIDRQGLALIRDWIHQLPEDLSLVETVEELIKLDESAALRAQTRDAEFQQWRLAQKIAQMAERDVVTQDDMNAAAEQANDDAARQATRRKRERESLVQRLLGDTKGAMLLARAIREGRLPEAAQEVALASAQRQDNLAIRDLFEPFLPEEDRTQRLGDQINAQTLLAMRGNAKRGADLFFKSEVLQCRNCHRVGEQGKQLGPDLTQIGKKLDRAKLLESLLEPARSIDPKYAAWLIETKGGKVFSGLLVRRTDEEVVLRDAQNVQHRFETDSLEGIFPLRTSIMPDRQLRQLTPQQVADLLAWLQSLQ